MVTQTTYIRNPDGSVTAQINEVPSNVPAVGTVSNPIGGTIESQPSVIAGGGILEGGPGGTVYMGGVGETSVTVTQGPPSGSGGSGGVKIKQVRDMPKVVVTDAEGKNMPLKLDVMHPISTAWTVGENIRKGYDEASQQAKADAELRKNPFFIGAENFQPTTAGSSMKTSSYILDTTVKEHRMFDESIFKPVNLEESQLGIAKAGGQVTSISNIASGLFELGKGSVYGALTAVPAAFGQAVQDSTVMLKAAYTGDFSGPSKDVGKSIYNAVESFRANPAYTSGVVIGNIATFELGIRSLNILRGIKGESIKFDAKTYDATNSETYNLVRFEKQREKQFDISHSFSLEDTKLYTQGGKQFEISTGVMRSYVKDIDKLFETKFLSKLTDKGKTAGGLVLSEADSYSVTMQMFAKKPEPILLKSFSQVITKVGADMTSPLDFAITGKTDLSIARTFVFKEEGSKALIPQLSFTKMTGETASLSAAKNIIETTGGEPKLSLSLTASLGKSQRDIGIMFDRINKVSIGDTSRFGGVRFDTAVGSKTKSIVANIAKQIGTDIKESLKTPGESIKLPGKTKTAKYSITKAGKDYKFPVVSIPGLTSKTGTGQKSGLNIKSISAGIFSSKVASAGSQRTATAVESISRDVFKNRSIQPVIDTTVSSSSMKMASVSISKLVTSQKTQLITRQKTPTRQTTGAKYSYNFRGILTPPKTYMGTSSRKSKRPVIGLSKGFIKAVGIKPTASLYSLEKSSKQGLARGTAVSRIYRNIAVSAGLSIDFPAAEFLKRSVKR